MARVQVFLCEVVHRVHGLCGCEERRAGAVAKEAQVAVVCHDQDWGIPGCLGGGGCAGADIVYGADVAAVEAEAGAGVEHLAVVGVGGEVGEWVGEGEGGVVVGD